MRGQVSAFLLWGAPFCRVSPCGASDFLDGQKVTKEPLGGGQSISGAQNLSGLRDLFRATGPWVCKNCRCCGSLSAPGLAEQVMAGPRSAGRPVSGPYEKRERLLCPP